MLSHEGPDIFADCVDASSLLTGLMRKSSGGREMVDHLAAVAAFGRYVAAGPSLSILLHDACELAALSMGADILLVAQLTGDAKRLTLHVAAFNNEQEVVVQSLAPIPADPSTSMAAFAMSSADLVQSEDIVAERRFTDLVLRRLQAGSGIVTSLCTHNRAFGAFGLARKQRGPFTLDESHFTQGIAHLLASYLAQYRAEERLQQREAWMQATMDSVESLILLLDEQGIVLEMNAAGNRGTGFRDREIRDRPFWNTVIAPSDSERVSAVFRHGCRPGTIAMFEADLLSKEGQQRAVQWSLSAMNAVEGAPRNYVLSGVDRTELRECNKELEKYRKIAMGAAQAAGCPAGAGRPRSADKPSGADKRSSPRREYSYFQRIAPILENRLPTDDQFQRVACCDISAGGLSYLLEAPPGYEEVVISLGTPPNDGKIIAKIVRVLEKEVNGQAMFQVGCQFVGRMAD